MAKIIDGKKISNKLLDEVKYHVEDLRKKNKVPCLSVILVGNNPASRVYVNNKKKACDKVGIKSEEYLLSEDISQEKLLELIDNLNKREDVNGILVQLPLPKQIDENAIIESISYKKDVDCFNPYNVGKLMQGTAQILPCTPAGIIELLEREKIEIEGKNCVVIGRSNIVGKPISMMMIQKNATVTVCHSRTQNLKEICRSADILIVAVGKAKFVTDDMVKEGSVIVDVGINRNNNGKLCGDVDYERVSKKAAYITPVPGGVGPMTIAMLMKNTLIASL